jgi:hypothetical protein
MATSLEKNGVSSAALIQSIILEEYSDTKIKSATYKYSYVKEYEDPNETG